MAQCEKQAKPRNVANIFVTASVIIAAIIVLVIIAGKVTALE